MQQEFGVLWKSTSKTWSHTSCLSSVWYWLSSSTASTLTPRTHVSTVAVQGPSGKTSASRAAGLGSSPSSSAFPALSLGFTIFGEIFA